MIDLVLESINDDLLKSIDESAHGSFLLIAILTEIPKEKKASSPFVYMDSSIGVGCMERSHNTLST